MVLQQKQLRLILVLLPLIRLGDAFFVVHKHCSLLTTRNLPPTTVTPSSRETPVVFASGDDNDDGDTNQEGAAARKTRRRKRRIVTPTVVEEETAAEEDASAPPPPAVPRQDAPVALAVTDVRNLVGGEATVATSSTTSRTSQSGRDALVMESKASDAAVSSPSSSVAPTNSLSTDDALARLLQDAREMQAANGGDGANSNLADKDNEPSIPKVISQVLSTVVTVDFFVVCGFLLWFLAGIFQSYVLQDDTIQIAFNSNFETLVQPALGILMVAAIAGNFFKEDEEDASV